MSIIDLSARRAPVCYTVRIMQHWDGRMEVFVEDVADDERSRRAVRDALHSAAEAWGAPSLHAIMLEQIDQRMDAKAGTPEVLELGCLASIVASYERAMWP